MWRRVATAAGEPRQILVRGARLWTSHSKCLRCTGSGVSLSLTHTLSLSRLASLFHHHHHSRCMFLGPASSSLLPHSPHVSRLHLMSHYFWHVPLSTWVSSPSAHVTNFSHIPSTSLTCLPRDTKSDTNLTAVATYRKTKIPCVFTVNKTWLGCTLWQGFDTLSDKFFVISMCLIHGRYFLSLFIYLLMYLILDGWDYGSCLRR